MLAQQKYRPLSSCHAHSLSPLPSVTRYVDIALAPEGISLVAIHPGMPRCALLCCDAAARPPCVAAVVGKRCTAHGAWRATVAPVSICAAKQASKPAARRCPAGYVKTDINQGAGDITAEESVRGILQGEQRTQQAQQAAHAHALRRPAALLVALVVLRGRASLAALLVAHAHAASKSASHGALKSCMHSLPAFTTRPPCLGTRYRTAVLEGGKDLHGRFYSWAGGELPW